MVPMLVFACTEWTVTVIFPSLHLPSWSVLLVPLPDMCEQAGGEVATHRRRGGCCYAPVSYETERPVHMRTAGKQGDGLHELYPAQQSHILRWLDGLLE